MLRRHQLPLPPQIKCRTLTAWTVAGARQQLSARSHLARLEALCTLSHTPCWEQDPARAGRPVVNALHGVPALNSLICVQKSALHSKKLDVPSFGTPFLPGNGLGGTQSIS